MKSHFQKYKLLKNCTFGRHFSEVGFEPFVHILKYKHFWGKGTP